MATHGRPVTISPQRSNAFDARVGGVVQVETDAARLRQVLRQLLENAAKFTEGGRIDLVARREQENGRAWIAFEVVDTGIGMSPADAERVMQPFTQVDDGYTRKQGGMGMGLALSRKICEALGGRLDLKSQPGKGSRITVLLPEAQAN